MSRNLKRWLLLVSRIVISVLLIWWVFSTIDPGQLEDQLSRSSPLLIVFAFGVLLFGNFVGVAQWLVFLKGAHIPIGFGRAAVYYFTGLFFNNFFFSSVGGDAVRVFEVTRGEKKETGRVLACIFVDRIFGLLCLLLTGNLALLVFALQGYPVGPAVLVGYAAVDATVLVGLLCFLSRRVRFFFYWFAKRLPGRRFRLGVFHFLQVLSGYRAGWRIFLRALPWGLANQLLRMFSALLVSLALGHGSAAIAPLLCFVLVPLLGIIKVLPLSVMGVGPAEFAGKHMFSAAGVAVPLSLSFLLFNQLLVTGINLLGGLFFLFRRVKEND